MHLCEDLRIRHRQAITGAHWSGPRFFGLNRSEAIAAVQPQLNASDAIGEGEYVNG
jgi:hypothetical protein